MMKIMTTENNDTIETVTLTDEEIEAFNDSEIIIDNAAVFTIDYDAQQLVVYFGGDRNAVMDLDDDFEVALCDKVLGDPNFWANFLGSLSAALKKSS